MKPQIKTANRPRQIRGKWSHSFERYCKSTSILSTKKITKVITGEDTAKGSEVMIKYQDKELVATIVGVAGRIRFILNMYFFT